MHGWDFLPPSQFNTPLLEIPASAARLFWINPVTRSPELTHAPSLHLKAASCHQLPLLCCSKHAYFFFYKPPWSRTFFACQTIIFLLPFISPTNINCGCMYVLRIHPPVSHLQPSYSCQFIETELCHPLFSSLDLIDLFLGLISFHFSISNGELGMASLDLRLRLVPSFSWCESPW